MSDFPLFRVEIKMDFSQEQGSSVVLFKNAATPGEVVDTVSDKLRQANNGDPVSLRCDDTGEFHLFNSYKWGRVCIRKVEE